MVSSNYFYLMIIESEKKDTYLDLARELKTMEHEDDGDRDCNWCARNNPQKLDKETGRFRNQRTSGNHPDYSIITIGQNTEQSPGDLRRLTVIPAPVEDHHLMQV